MVTAPLAEDDLLLLHAALRWWQTKGGFRFVNLPWVVAPVYSQATRPAWVAPVMTSQGEFVGSGEQSFLQLHVRKQLPPAPGYVGWTPCLREEPEFDALHHLGFLKAELFVPVEDRSQVHVVLQQMLARQKAAFEALAHTAGVTGPVRVSEEQLGPAEVDLVIGGVEVGSYGVRRMDDWLYVYGTALALPRFRQALHRAGLTPAV